MLISVSFGEVDLAFIYNFFQHFFKNCTFLTFTSDHKIDLCHTNIYLKDQKNVPALRAMMII